MVLTGQNVCATLERRKFQTRRIINPQPGIGSYKGWAVSKGIWRNTQSFPGQRWKALFQVGGRAYVRAYVAEGYQIIENTLNWVQGKYLADDKEFKVVLTSKEHNLFIDRKFPHRKTPGRFMYKSLARIFLPIVEVRIERLQDITATNCEAEGLKLTTHPNLICGKYNRILNDFKALWDSIHGEGAWDRNDWVFVYRWDEIIIKGE